MRYLDYITSYSLNNSPHHLITLDVYVKYRSVFVLMLVLNSLIPTTDLTVTAQYQIKYFPLYLSLITGRV